MASPKAAYHKPTPDYPRCPGCHRHSAVNYIKQVQRGMRLYTCARCKVMFFIWGPKLLNPRKFRDYRGRSWTYKD